MLKLNYLLCFSKTSLCVNCWSCTWHYCISCGCCYIYSKSTLRCILASSRWSTNISWYRSTNTSSFWTTNMVYSNSITNNYSKCSTTICSTWWYCRTIFNDWIRVTCTPCNKISWPIDCFCCSRWRCRRCSCRC